MKTVKPIVIAALILLASCKDPALPDPTIAYPQPPSELMEPPGKMIPIPTEDEDGSQPISPE